MTVKSDCPEPRWQQQVRVELGMTGSGRPDTWYISARIATWMILQWTLDSEDPQ